MSLAFYMDVHIPAAVTRGLRLREVDEKGSSPNGA